MNQSNLLVKKYGCSCCSNTTVVRGINDIATTDPWMIEFLANKEDAYKYTKCSGEKILMKCIDCGEIKTMEISRLYQRKTISCTCGNGVSYPNKLMFYILKELNMNFQAEHSPEWLKQKRFDFYIPSLSLIIEMDGGLGHGKKDTKTLTSKESKEIDGWKDSQAFIHGLKVIRIDCNYNGDRFIYIKNNILDSELNGLLKINNLNWKKIDKLSTKNIVREVCEYYEEHKHDLLLKDIHPKYNINRHTLTSYLKKGSEFGWCNYEIKNPTRPIRVIETGDVFNGTRECAREFKKKYNVKLDNGSISRVLNGKLRSHKGYHFEYVD